MANDFLHKPIHIQLGDASGGLQANADITQHLILLPSADEKDDELCKLVNHRVKLETRPYLQHVCNGLYHVNFE